MSWDGENRRELPDGHDLLIRIDANLTNHIAVVAKHVIDDEVRFSKIDKDLVFHNKLLYGALGIIAFMELFVKFLK